MGHGPRVSSQLCQASVDCRFVVTAGASCRVLVYLYDKFSCQRVERDGSQIVGEGNNNIADFVVFPTGASGWVVLPIIDDVLHWSTQVDAQHVYRIAVRCLSTDVQCTDIQSVQHTRVRFRSAQLHCVEMYSAVHSTECVVTDAQNSFKLSAVLCPAAGVPSFAYIF